MENSNIKFKQEPQNGFYKAIRQAADAYFLTHKVARYGNTTLYMKAFLLIFAYVTAYFFVLRGGTPMIIAYMTMGFLTVPIVLNIGHESVHNTFSPYPRLNLVLSYVFNLVGTDNHIWRHKHVNAHHIFPNIAGHDLDIAQNNLARIAPSAPYFNVHRFQHFYMPFLYLIYTLNWLIYRDFKDFRLHFAGKPNSILHFLGLLLSKVFYVGYALVLPIYFMPVYTNSIILGFILMQFIMSATTFLVLVSAHVGENAVFPEPDSEGKIGHTWSEHQLITTTDFAPESNLVTHLFGGFNHHVAHHLFPQVSHIHYPVLTKIVAEKAAEFGLPYNCFESIGASVSSHFYFLKKNGLPSDFFETVDI